MIWILAILLVLVTAVLFVREKQRREADMRLAAALEKIAAGEEPTSISGALSPHFGKIKTEIAHSRRQRQLAEANLQIILSTMQEGVLVVDSRRTVRLANPSARKMFALPENFFGQPVLENLREPVVDEMIAAALTTAEPQDRELEIGSGRVRSTVTVHVAPMRDASGEAGALVMFRDVTRLTQLEKVRREFVANVSHELRTPLTIFQGYVESLMDFPDMPREDQAQSFAVLHKHSQRLNALVEDLLILARLEARRDEMHREPLEPAAFLAECARDWALHVEKKGVALVVQAAPGLATISADRLRLEQVFNNLVENALKYTPAGGTITLAGAMHGDFVELSVRDTGQGILSTDLPHIFERFYRADKARSRELGGTGLGLSIVKHIAQAHGGQVGAESVYGQGTRIWLRLPAA